MRPLLGVRAGLIILDGLGRSEVIPKALIGEGSRVRAGEVMTATGWGDVGPPAKGMEVN